MEFIINSTSLILITPQIAAAKRRAMQNKLYALQGKDYISLNKKKEIANVFKRHQAAPGVFYNII